MAKSKSMPNDKDVPDDKDIYLAFSTVFSGSSAQIRNKPAIQRHVQNSEEQPEVARFLSEYKHDEMRDVIYGRLKVLLDQRVFESSSNAIIKV